MTPRTLALRLEMMTDKFDGSPLRELVPDEGESDPDQRLLIDYVHEAGEWGPPRQIESLLAQRRFLGDVVLASETVRAEAAQKDNSVHDHLAHLVIHGILHLLGFDHATEAEADAMERIEVRVLARLAIPDPYLSHNNEEVFDRPA